MAAKDAYLVVGLGNPGGQYEGTRHNVGFATLDLIAADYHIDISHKSLGNLLGRGRVADRDVFLVKPQSYMNLSGGPVRRIMDYFKLPRGRLMVIHDDLDLEVGRIKVAVSGGPGGHKGVASIIETLADQRFVRIKIGIGRPPDQASAVDYVLGRFPAHESTTIHEAMTMAAEAVVVLMTAGATSAQNKFNRKAVKSD